MRKYLVLLYQVSAIKCVVSFFNNSSHYSVTPMSNDEMLKNNERYLKLRDEIL